MSSRAIEDQIEAYTYEHFDASQSAQHIFAALNENEVTRKLNEMNTTQQVIESVLKQEVKKNYGVFISATDQIQQVGQDLADLKHLIENTQKIIADVQQTKISDSKAMRNNSLLPSIQLNKAVEETKRNMESFKKEEDMPLWLEKAPNELAQYIVEQQYKKAVTIVLQAKTFSETTSAEALSNKAHDALQQISERGTLLAATLKKSLLTFPNSALWGMTQQYERLKLLITLCEYSQAADGFSLIQEQTMQKALSSVETSTDILFYSRELSRSFFSSLFTALSLYHSLFTNTQQNGNRELVMLLVQWTQRQIALFVLTLSRQCVLVVNESAMLWIIHLRDVTQWRANTLIATFASGSANGSENNADSMNMNITPTKAVRGRPRRQSILIPQNLTPGPLSPARSTLSPSASTTLHTSLTTAPVVNAQAADDPLGGLFLLSNILSSAFLAAQEYQEKQEIFGERDLSQSSLNKSLPLTTFLSALFISETTKMVTTYLEEFIREGVSQIRQDAWIAIRAPSLIVQGAFSVESRNAFNSLRGAEEDLVAVSFSWMVTALDHLLLDVSTLLNGDPKNPNAFDRSDVAEVEAVAVSGLLRLVLRYVIEIEAMDVSAFSRAQQQCCLNTVKALSNHLIPSLQAAFDLCFLPERLYLMSTCPANVFDTMSMRLGRLAQELSEMFSL